MSYLYLKALHIIFVITWFAGLFYVVRLFIYHTEALSKAEPDRSILSAQLALMTRKLWYIITWPSAIITLVLATALLISQPAWLQMPFMHIKLTFVFFLYVYHFLCHRLFLRLQKNEARYSTGQLRVFNEVATLILFAVVFLIVLKSQISWLWATVGLIMLGVLLMMAIKLYKRFRKS